MTAFIGCSSFDACLACPWTQTTFPIKWQIPIAQQSHGKFVGIEYNNEFEKEADDMLEENYMTVYVKMICEKTISIKCDRNWSAAVILDEVERRSSITRDMIRLVYKGKKLSEKKTMKERNIEAEATIEMSLRLFGGMEMNEQMNTYETEEDREKKRKLEEGKEGKAMKSNDDMIYLKRDIMEALTRSDEKWKATQERLMRKIESYSKNADDRMDDFSREADEMLEKFMVVTNTVGSQIQGMKSSIVSKQEMNEKWKKVKTSSINLTKELRRWKEKSWTWTKI